jgi:antitoxin (DNA-binding transcriptional repressor) of toxin-antitoxin stability system
MKTFSVAHVKTNLSSILKEVESGEEIAISFGKKKEMIAVIVSYNAYKQSKKRKLGTLKGKMSVEFKEDFKMSDDELFGE